MAIESRPRQHIMKPSERELEEERQALIAKSRRKGTRVTKKKLLEAGMSEKAAVKYLEGQKKFYQNERSRKKIHAGSPGSGKRR